VAGRDESVSIFLLEPSDIGGGQLATLWQRQLEAEVLALTNVVGEVCKRLATISPRHDAAVRGGLDSASRTLSVAQEYARASGPGHTFDYALTCVDIYSEMVLAPTQGGRRTGRCSEGPTAATSAPRRCSTDERPMRFSTKRGVIPRDRRR
jgi:hypothetical protein